MTPIVQWLEIAAIIAYRWLNSLDTHHYMLLMVFFELWLILHYAGKLKLFKLQQRTELSNLKSEIYSSVQISILEQAMLYDRELRKLQQQVSQLRLAIDGIKQQALAPSPAAHHDDPLEGPHDDRRQELVGMLIESKRRGLRRLCISGRGWISANKFQQELGFTDSEVVGLCK